jgi:hypothetical protein
MSYVAEKKRGRLRERFEAPEEYVGYVVCDPLGQKIGKLEKLFVNAHQEPEYVRVTLGFFEFRTALIPVQAVAVDEGRRALLLQ